MSSTTGAFHFHVWQLRGSIKQSVNLGFCAGMFSMSWVVRVDATSTLRWNYFLWSKESLCCLDSAENVLLCSLDLWRRQKLKIMRERSLVERVIHSYCMCRPSAASVTWAAVLSSNGSFLSPFNLTCVHCTKLFLSLLLGNDYEDYSTSWSPVWTPTTMWETFAQVVFWLMFYH